MSLAALCLTACPGRQPSDVLATFGTESLTVADLDAYLLTLPESARPPPAGESRESWLEGRIRRLALERLLAASAEMAQLAASPEAAKAGERSRESLLAQAMLRQLAGETEPTAEEVAAKAAELAGQQRDESVLNFQHIFFRLDRSGSRQEIRARAAEVVAAARADGDFPALARQHSDSADADAGGLVQNARPSDLDAASAAALAALAEGEVSPLVETRTGLHVFRLIRRLEPEPPSAAQLETSARSSLQRERLTAAQTELVAGLQERAGVETGGEHKLLAEEAAARGLETPELAAQVERGVRLGRLERLFNQRRLAFDAELGEDVLRPFYEAQPSLFSTREQTHLELIFVPQGGDSFATQKRLEKRVAELRAGASFAAMARAISKGPAAEDGGDLGPVEASELARYGPAIAAAVPELAAGEISDPVYCTGRILSREPKLLRGGFAILRVKERVAPRQRGFEEAIDDVRRAYAAQNRRQLDLEIQDRILAEAGFEILRLPAAEEFLR